MVKNGCFSTEWVSTGKQISAIPFDAANQVGSFEMS